MKKLSPTNSYEIYVSMAYEHTNRDLLGIVTNLQCEASELAELIVKKEWYNKNYSKEEIISEAGDILNFLTICLIRHGVSLEEAMEDNIKKLKQRNWIK